MDRKHPKADLKSSIPMLLMEGQQDLASRILEDLLKSGELSAEAIHKTILGLSTAQQDHLLISRSPWLAEICGGFDDETRAKLYTASLASASPPYVGRFTYALTLWHDDPDWLTEPDDEEPTPDCGPVFEIGEGEDQARKEENPRPPNSAPVSERMQWLETETRRKKRHLDTLLARLELEKVLLAFFLGSVPGGEVIRRAELEAFERSMRTGGMESGWRRRVLDRLMQAIRDGDEDVIRHMLSKYSWLRSKILKFLLKRFHLIGAIMALLDLASILHDWASASRCRMRLDELDELRWEWMTEAGIVVKPGETALLGPYINPGALGIPAGTPCEHSVTYIFIWEDEAGEKHEEVLAGPRPLQTPGSNGEDLPPGALTDTQNLPSPEIPESFVRGYIVYEFITRCPGREPIVSRLFAVAITGPSAALGPH